MFNVRISNKVLQDEKDAKLSDLIKKVRADEQHSVKLINMQMEIHLQRKNG